MLQVADPVVELLAVCLAALPVEAHPAEALPVD
jgi:hypothetical protein